MEELLFGEEINQEVDFSNIFNKVPVTISEVKSPADGLVLSLANRGKVDISYIAELCQIDKHKVIETLKGSILQNPLTWNEKYDEGWETKEEYLAERGAVERACSEIVLIADIVHTEQHGRHQGDDHHTHNALRVDGVVNVHATSLCRVVGHVKEGLKAVEHRAEGMQLTTLLEVRLHLI